MNEFTTIYRKCEAGDCDKPPVVWGLCLDHHWVEQPAEVRAKALKRTPKD